MKIKTYIKRKALRALMAAMAVLPFIAFVSCDSVIYDYEGDCSVSYRLKFRYDKNLKWADAFANEVSSVHLYAFDPSGVLVWQREDRVDPATADNYSMLLDLPAGDYKLLAWCGLCNDGEREESFSVPEARVGETRMEQLQCALNRKHDESGAYSKDHLYRLFHGMLDVSLPENEDGGSYNYTMPLTKNTNHIRVILQHLSGEDVNKADFTFRIDDENGLMAHDKELVADENINYRRYQQGECPCRQRRERTRRRLHRGAPDRNTSRENDTHHHHQGRQNGGPHPSDRLRFDGKRILRE